MYQGEQLDADAVNAWLRLRKPWRKGGKWTAQFVITGIFNHFYLQSATRVADHFLFVSRQYTSDVLSKAAASISCSISQLARRDRGPGHDGSLWKKEAAEKNCTFLPRKPSRGFKLAIGRLDRAQKSLAGQQWRHAPVACHVGAPAHGSCSARGTT
ncbi:hypothetical protein BC940DRAFT_11174 [Gongronella butleri]|nr:hypothetical protein BC940DRAFT_11174 [Gongronella butleri]